MTKNLLAPVNKKLQDFSVHLPNKVLTDKELAARFENLKKLIALAKKQSSH